ncbi:hypothetical protein VF21_01735 [Pseudogymnoascus sp. 05NY08]|nr:hypothetical protein VF21_01735 [Pseudogymnoascus sp. 05NY08]
MAAQPNPEYNAALAQRDRENHDELIRLRAENLLYRQQLEVCHDRFGDDCHEPYVKPEDWLRLLRRHQFTRDEGILRKIYKAACKQYNMSCVPQKHGLHWVPPYDRRIRRERTVANTDVGFQDGQFFDFARLMKECPKIAIKIISYTMVKHAPISVVARFDVHDIYPPTQGGVDPETGLSYRFHWGSRACAINSAPLPRDVLAPMFVCRDWYEMFGTAFYFLNAFSFESLGEFQIFCERTPDRCLERIVTMMITWIGSRMATSNPRRKGPRYCPSRHGMHRMNKLINLRTLEIRINETSPDRVRRKHENQAKKKPLKKSTKDHQNYSGNRCFRTIRGLDSITQLRGLERLEIFDYNRKYPKAIIKDRTFLDDTRRQVYTPKCATDKAKADLKSLQPLWKREGLDEWVMSHQVRNIILGIFGLPLDDAEDERPNNAGDDLDDDDNDAGSSDDQNPGDGDDTDDDDHDQGGNHNHNPHDDSNSESEDDDAPDQGGNALRATPALSGAGNFDHGGGENDDDEDEDIGMDELNLNQGGKSGDDSDDDDFEFIHSAKLSPIKVEDDDELEFLHSVKLPTQMIDLSQLPDMEDPDTAIPSIEQDEVKQEVKSEDPTAAESRESMESIPFFDEQTPPQREVVSPFGRLTPRRGSTPQSSLFVRQSPSSRSSFSSRVFGFFGTPGSERKRSFEDEDDDEDVATQPSLRRRLSGVTIDDIETEEQ